MTTLDAFASEGEAIRTSFFTPGAVTYYFRTTFVLSNDFSGMRLASTNYIDDGAVFYLNGQFAGLFRMTNPAPAFDALVINAIPEGKLTNAILDAELLQPGTNILAVEVHQNSTTSADIVFGMRLYLVPPPPLQITRSPASLELNAGESTTFSVAVTGQAPQFQWLFDGEPIPGANLPILQITNAQLAHAGGYSVMVTNTTESVTNQVARLTVWQPPIIHSQPDNLRLFAGENLRLDLAVTGTEPMSFQWYFNGIALTNGQQAGLAINNADTPHSGSYWIAISNRVGLTLSEPMHVTVANAYFAQTSAGDRTAIRSQGMSLSMEVLPGINLSLQFKNNLNDVSWQILTNFNSNSGEFQFQDSQATNHPHRFYRVWKKE